MTEVVIEILVELLSTLALVTKQIKEGKPSESVFGGVLYLPGSMQHRKTCKEVLWREGRRGCTPKARPTHPRRGSHDRSADPRGHLRPYPEYEGGNGR
jgi:hypothetical protein